MKNLNRNNILLISAIIVIGFVIRLIPHFPNFAPIGAIALFAGAFYMRSFWAVAATAIVWWLSDLYINNFGSHPYETFTWFTADQIFGLLSVIAIVGVAKIILKQKNITTIFLGSISASLIFFIISNFGVWLQGYMYPMTANGLLTCYIMAIPFYKATLVSDFLFSFTFFGLMYIITQKETNLVTAN